MLLAEDDPVSARFLAEALSLLGARVETCADGTSALAAARAQRFDLLLLDLGLPGLDGSAVLRALRADPRAVSRGTRAIATSAGARSAADLDAAGFAGLLRKPATVDRIAAALGPRAPAVAEPASAQEMPVLDDGAALAALGGMEAVADLRALLAAELPGQLRDLVAALAAGETAAARAVLHRLHASTRFCGASGLAEAGTRLAALLASPAHLRDRDAALQALATAADAYLRAVSR